LSAKPNGIKLVLLDWAGTVLDFGCRAPAGAFVAAFAGAGVTVSITEARGPMGLHKKDHIRAMLKVPEIGQRWQGATGKAWTEADVDALYRTVTPMQVEAAKKHAELIPEVLACVAELRKRGIKIAGSTGYFREAAEVCYTAAERQGYKPDFAICADEVPAGRPAPWMIFRAMEALDVYPPTAVVKVGDTLIDIADGQNAGVWSVGVVDSSNEIGLSEAEWSALSEEDKDARRSVVHDRYAEAGADAGIDSLAELPELIDELNAILKAKQAG
jgi:phosphonoacetaldehyde hydrolase